MFVKRVLAVVTETKAIKDSIFSSNTDLVNYLCVTILVYDSSVASSTSSHGSSDSSSSYGSSGYSSINSYGSNGCSGTYGSSGYSSSSNSYGSSGYMRLIF